MARCGENPIGLTIPGACPVAIPHRGMAHPRQAQGQVGGPRSRNARICTFSPYRSTNLTTSALMPSPEPVRLQTAFLNEALLDRRDVCLPIAKRFR
jgi:hypothetical protein